MKLFQTTAELKLARNPSLRGEAEEKVAGQDYGKDEDVYKLGIRKRRKQFMAAINVVYCGTLGRSNGAEKGNDDTSVSGDQSS